MTKKQNITVENRWKRRSKKTLGALKDSLYLGLGGIVGASLMAAATYTIGSDDALAAAQSVQMRNNRAVSSHIVDAMRAIQQTDSAHQAEHDAADGVAEAENTHAFSLAAVTPIPVAKALPNFPYQQEINVKVSSGDTLAEILQENSIGIDDTNAAILALKKHYDPRDIRQGQKFSLQLKQFADHAKLESLILPIDSLNHVELKNSNNKFTAKKVAVETEKQIARAGGTVYSSFYETGKAAGIPSSIIMELMKAYSYDIDFQRDIKAGQKIDVLFEQLVTEDSGRVVGHGDLKYAAYKVGKKTIEIYKYKDKDGQTGYYKPNGESVRKALLKTPVNGARISSSYGMRRHPVLGYSKMHKGIDFAARTGTPIYAAGDGKIAKAGRNGGYGNYVKINHNNQYSSAYAHMSKFAKGIKAGKRVKQGDIIGYVGSTGRSTGPHLHYEILKNGKHINPNGAKFRTGRKLSGKELASFKKQKQRLTKQFAELPRIREQVASAQ